jgi:hypothetical protein
MMDLEIPFFFVLVSLIVVVIDAVVSFAVFIFSFVQEKQG